VTGESGTGKEVISNLIHRDRHDRESRSSPSTARRFRSSFWNRSCSGHEKGAFTADRDEDRQDRAGGRRHSVPGRDRRDEPIVQAKFLRVLEEREFQRLGGTRTLRADVRVIAATNGTWRTASRSRRSARTSTTGSTCSRSTRAPAQAARGHPSACGSLPRGSGEDDGPPAAGISRDAARVAAHLSLARNVRELRNAIERAILLCDGGLISAIISLPGVAHGASATANGARRRLRNGHCARERAPRARTVRRTAPIRRRSKI